MRRLVASLFLCAAAAIASAKTYSVEGMLLRVEEEKQRVVISHREIPGYMPAMAMPFSVRDKRDLLRLRPGMRVRFELQVKAQEAIIRSIKPIAIEPLKDVPVLRPSLKMGDEVPDFQLTDQSGEEIRLSSLRDKPVLLDFIYTRCPLPEVCPRLSANFAYLQKKFGSQVQLVSLTLDPTWDKPEVLRDYAKRWRADTQSWHFLTGTMEQVRNVAAQFGVVYYPEDDALVHSSVVVLIGRDGRIAGTVEGTSYPLRQLVDLVNEQLLGADSKDVEHSKK